MARVDADDSAAFEQRHLVALPGIVERPLVGAVAVGAAVAMHLAEGHRAIAPAREQFEFAVGPDGAHLGVRWAASEDAPAVEQCGGFVPGCGVEPGGRLGGRDGAVELMAPERFGDSGVSDEEFFVRRVDRDGGVGDAVAPPSPDGPPGAEAQAFIPVEDRWAKVVAS